MRVVEVTPVGWLDNSRLAGTWAPRVHLQVCLSEIRVSRGPGTTGASASKVVDMRSGVHVGRGSIGRGRLGLGRRSTWLRAPIGGYGERSLRSSLPLAISPICSYADTIRSSITTTLAARSWMP